MRKSSIANFIYLFLVILFLTFGAYFQKKELNMGLIITEYIIVFFPALIFSFILNKGKLKDFLRLNKVSLKKIIYSIIITICTYPIAVFGNLIIISIINYFGKINIPKVPIASNANEYLWFLFLIGVTPGICEETLFRGFFLRINEEKGLKLSIVYTAFLFALFHFNIYNFMGPLILGIVFGYMTMITNSIYPSMISHALNNSIASTIGYFAFRKLGNVDVVQDKIPLEIILYQLIFFGIISMFSYFIIKKLFKKINDNNNVCERKNDIRNDIYSYMPILICILIYTYMSIKIH